jgi:hypothetical protein
LTATSKDHVSDRETCGRYFFLFPSRRLLSLCGRRDIGVLLLLLLLL